MLVLACTLLLSSCGSDVPKKKVAVIMPRSVADDVVSVEDLQDRLGNYDVDCELMVHFQNLREEYVASMQKELNSFIKDTLSRWNPDVVMVKGTRSLQHILPYCQNELKDVEVVYCSVSSEMRDVLPAYENVRGFIENANQLVPVHLAESLTQTTRMHIDYQNDSIDRTLYKDALDNFELVRFPYITYNTEGEVAVKDTLRNDVHVCFYPFTKVDEQTKNTYLESIKDMNHALLIDRLWQNEVFNMVKDYPGPVYTLMSDAFYAVPEILGGYICDRNTMLDEWTHLAAAVLKGGAIPSIQSQEHTCSYVFHYDQLSRFGLKKEDLPQNSVIEGLPASDFYHNALIIGILVMLLVMLLLAVSAARKIRKHKAYMQKKTTKYNQRQDLMKQLGNRYNVFFTIKDNNVYVDDHYLQLMGRKGKFIELKEIEQYIHPEDKEKYKDLIRKVSKERFSELKFQANFGGKVYLHYVMRCGIMRDSNKHRVVAGLLQNVESEFRHREALRRSTELVRESLGKTSFYDSITHEIRTPINSILGFTDLLASEEAQYLSDADIQSFAMQIRNNNMSLMTIIDDILEMSQLDSGKSTFRMIRTDLNAEVRDAIESERSYIREGLEYSCETPSYPLYVDIDKDKLATVIRKLVANSSKFTESGYIKIITKRNKDGFACMIVEDTGCGIPKDKLQMITHRFYKGDTLKPGTGLGLSICLAILERFKAVMTVESEEGKGSRFIVTFPQRSDI